MGSAFALSLVINTFNQPDYLGRVLNAVSRQSVLPEEVLLADDGSADETKIGFQPVAGRRNRSVASTSGRNIRAFAARAF